MTKASTHDAEIDNSSRSTAPQGEAFLRYIGAGWAERSGTVPDRRESAGFAAHRRAALGAQFPGERLVFHAGTVKQRSNDTFFPFRAHSAFAHLTGWGGDSEPGAVLVMDPVGEAPRDGDDGDEDRPSHRATVYFREAAGRDSDEFFANSEIGEFWVGPRPTLVQVAASLGIDAAPLETFEHREGDRIVGSGHGTPESDDEDLARAASELRLVKDAYEVAELQRAIDSTALGFDEVLASLGRARETARGERVVEGVFNLRARMDGNAVGYETIAAAGHHACTLHWVRNDGPVRDGELLLLDAGVEVDSLYTADITRTIPISGAFTAVQRRVYEAVLDAADAARRIVRPGIRFGDVHDEAMRVIAERTRAWGLPVTDHLGGTEAGLTDSGEPIAHHRRYMVHGTSHHLGLDVHDCAQARREMYLDGTVEAGMVFTIEPGLYFQPDDLTVPEEYRGIGIRIEDDILVTETGCVNLSAAIPRTPDAVEEWVRAAGQHVPALA